MPLIELGLQPVPIDCALDTLNVSSRILLKTIQKHPIKMLFLTNLLGFCDDIDEIQNLCKANRVLFFEDNCESMGAKFNGKHTGTFGLINTFSTFFSHHISTMEGGLILTNDKELYYLAKSLRTHGWTRGLPDDSGLYKKKYDDFFEAYRFILPGYNVRPGELHGAIGKVQLKKLDKFLKIRRKNAKYFQKLFKNDKRFIIQKETGKSSWFCFTMILNPKSGISRDKVLQKLKKANIEYILPSKA